MIDACRTRTPRLPPFVPLRIAQTKSKERKPKSKNTRYHWTRKRRFSKVSVIA